MPKPGTPRSSGLRLDALAGALLGALLSMSMGGAWAQTAAESAAQTTGQAAPASTAAPASEGSANTSGPDMTPPEAAVDTRPAVLKTFNALGPERIECLEDGRTSVDRCLRRCHVRSRRIRRSFRCRCRSGCRCCLPGGLRCRLCGGLRPCTAHRHAQQGTEQRARQRIEPEAGRAGRAGFRHYCCSM